MRTFLRVLIALCLSCSDGYKPDFILKPNVDVSLHGYEGATQEEMQAEIDSTITKVSEFVPSATERLTQATLHVHFEPGLGDCKELNADCPDKLVGYTTGTIAVIYYSTIVDGKYVTTPSAKLQQLAFSHEIAHAILLRASIPARTQHEIMSKLGL